MSIIDCSTTCETHGILVGNSEETCLKHPLYYINISYKVRVKEEIEVENRNNTIILADYYINIFNYANNVIYDLCKFITRTIVNYNYNVKSSIIYKKQNDCHSNIERFITHTYIRKDGICVCIITDKIYNRRNVYYLIEEVLKKFDEIIPSYTESPVDFKYSPQLQESLKELADKFQHPNEELKELINLKEDLSKEAKLKVIDDLFDSSNELLSLIDKSKDLNEESREFAKGVKAEQHRVCYACIIS